MNEKMKIAFEGLNCAHCAGKIEEKVNGLDCVEKASLNFVNKEMKVYLNKDESLDTVFDRIEGIVNSIEPGVVIRLAGEKKEEKDDEVSATEKIVRFVVGIVLFGIALFTDGFVSTACYVFAYAVFGYDVIWRAISNIVRGQVFDENFLMSIATLGAFYIGEFPEAVAVMLFYQIGEFFQDMAVDKSRRSIKDLMDISVETATVVRDEDTLTISPEEVSIGDIVLVKAGEKVPLDGVIKEGSSSLDMAALTGESQEVFVKEGDTVLSGSINTRGVIKIEVTKEYKNSTVSRIMEMVENASENKSKTESFITKFAKIYTPIVVVCAVLLAVVPTVLGLGEWSVWLSRALVFLVSSCPCALVVSIPLTFFSGLGESSKKGVLIKGSNYLQALADVNTAVFDKTGTLTKGVFEVQSINGGEVVLKYAASLEKYSNHPVGRAILNKYSGEYLEVGSVEEIGGYGLKGVISDKVLLVGNDKLMTKEKVDFEEHNARATIVYVALDGKYMGSIAVADSLKPNMKEDLDRLKKIGIKRLVMLTGDKKEVAESVAESIGITDVYAELLPQNKVEKIEEIYLNTQNAKIAFLGDGINDAPVLARADVGVAMGGIGSDAAMEAADVVIMNDDIAKLSGAIGIARGTMAIARQNVAFVLIIKIGVLVLASFGYAGMWLAVFADVGVALLAILNSMRVKFNK